MSRIQYFIQVLFVSADTCQNIAQREDLEYSQNLYSKGLEN